MACSICKKEGHNKLTHGKRRCSVCKNPYHDIRKCPKATLAKEKNIPLHDKNDKIWFVFLRNNCDIHDSEMAKVKTTSRDKATEIALNRCGRNRFSIVSVFSSKECHRFYPDWYQLISKSTPLKEY